MEHPSNSHLIVTESSSANLILIIFHSHYHHWVWGPSNDYLAYQRYYPQPQEELVDFIRADQLYRIFHYTLHKVTNQTVRDSYLHDAGIDVLIHMN